MKKKIYLKPQMNVTIVHIEEGICTGSAYTKPQGTSDVTTEWELGTDEELIFTPN